MSQRTLGIALLGHGIVGAGVATLLHQQAELLAQRTGLRFVLKHVVVNDAAKHSAANAGGARLPITKDAIGAIDDPETDIVIELVGGTSTAAAYIERALKLGKPVVTANKSLLALRGPELFALARKHDTAIAFEASCAGGIPIINALLHGLVANRIDALVGIVNGTCNFILTQMTRQGWNYPQALKAAQEAGFAEADPTLDVSGRDAAQKLALLASLAFNTNVTEAHIHVEGIDTLQDQDIRFAGELGYVIKLLAIAERQSAAKGDALSLRVHPTLVHKSDVLAEVSGSFNAVSVFGSALGHALFYGRGAGRFPTASAVVADLVNVALGVTAKAFSQLNLFPENSAPPVVLPFQELTSRYYLRLMAKDQPGVMAQVTKILGDNQISLSAILQHESSDNALVPIVITTHRAKEGAVQKSLREMAALATIEAPPVCLRIIDQPKEFGNG